MKIIVWVLGVAFAAWLLAFIGIKVYDLGCVSNPSVCVVETGIWLRKLVLLEWASKWQTLLAGVGAVAGGAFVLLSTSLQLTHVRSKEIIAQNRSLSHELYIAFQALLTVGRTWQLTTSERIIYLDQALISMRHVTLCCPQLATELAILLSRLRITGETRSLDAALLQAYSMVVVTIADKLKKSSTDIIPLESHDINMLPSVILEISDESGIDYFEFGAVLKYCSMPDE